MKVFKFGGASVKDADSVRNVAEILRNYDDEKVVIVISAMGKTTNALENVLNLYWDKKDFRPKLNEVKQYHSEIMNALFADKDLNVFIEIEAFFKEVTYVLENNSSNNYDYLYDQVIGFG